MSTPPIRGFLPNTLIDWPGRLAAEVFLPGCNLRCPYCHAGGLVRPPAVAETFDIEDILRHLREQVGWLDGVVLSGGEPTIHPELPRLARRFKEAGLPVKLDTNGTNPDLLGELLAQGLVDSVALDVKAPLDERYRRAAGRADLDPAAVRRTLSLLREWAGDYELRTTVCPAVLTPEDVLDLAAQVAGAPVLVLQQFRPGHCLEPALNDLEPYPGELLVELAERCRAHVPRTLVRGTEGILTPQPG